MTSRLALWATVATIVVGTSVGASAQTRFEGAVRARSFERYRAQIFR